MDTNSRIIGTSTDISYDSVTSFFEERAGRELANQKLYGILSDELPDAAIQRDSFEKARVESVLEPQAGMTVLELGCGGGRWGELFCKKGAYYIGLDNSAGMIDRARENLSAYENKNLLVCDIKNVDAVQAALQAAAPGGVPPVCDIVLFSGVLMYLNDNDVKQIFSFLPRYMKKGSYICLVESMSDVSRLTLKDFYSEALQRTYSAIYRTSAEFSQMLTETYVVHAGGAAIKLVRDERMEFPDGLQKQREHVTMDHCMVWQVGE